MMILQWFEGVISAKVGFTGGSIKLFRVKLFLLGHPHLLGIIHISIRTCDLVLSAIRILATCIYVVLAPKVQR